MVLNNTCECMHTLCKNAYGLVHARICNRAECRSFFAMEVIVNLSWVLCEHRAGCHLLPALLPARQNQSPDAVCLRNPFKSTLAHDTVAAAVLHKHHLIICVGAALIHFVYRSHSCLATEATRHKKSIFAIFRASLFMYFGFLSQWESLPANIRSVYSYTWIFVYFTFSSSYLFSCRTHT